MKILYWQKKMAIIHKILVKFLKIIAKIFHRYNVFVYLCSRKRISETLGLTGLDGELKWYVSTRSGDCRLHNLCGQKINWQQRVCSRCLIEVQ